MLSLILILSVYVSHYPISVSAFSISNNEQNNYKIQNKSSMSMTDRHLHRCSISMMTIITSATLVFASPLDVSAIQPSDLSSMTADSVTQLGLKPPTSDKPQIMFNRVSESSKKQQTTSQSKGNSREPILQGLVYFPEIAPRDPSAKVAPDQQKKQALDYYSDILVLTAISATQPDGPVLAGAKFPVSTVRFPFSFQMYKENLLTSRSGVEETWNKISKTEDVILKASICPSDAVALPCDSKESKKSAEGIAKLITNLPGLKEGEVIRAPASLPLI